MLKYEKYKRVLSFTYSSLLGFNQPGLKAMEAARNRKQEALPCYPCLQGTA